MTHPGQPERSIVPAPDGGDLEVIVDGPADGLPLVFHTGTPSGLTASGPLTSAAAERGLRMVLYSRPGYGRSTARPGRLVASAAADVSSILSHLGTDAFVTAGWSGGGPHALACAAQLPGRCLAAAAIAGPAPRDASGLDWLDGMGAENIDEFTAAEAGADALSPMLEQASAALAGITAGGLAAGLGDLLSAADRPVLGTAFGEYLAASFRASVSSGAAGWRDDDLAFVRDWGFRLAACAGTPVAIWQGGQDRMVPGAHGEWLAANVPGAQLRLRPQDGHLSLVAGSFGEILDDLMKLAGR
ncbi:MAG TPA: alpha/beta hydrolase [Streptosporangiaceae bacterium]|jgi:pimeloyl-ACP methyl ester carboxylesterase